MRALPMSNFTAIRAVTDTLSTLLEQELGITTERNISPHLITSTTPLVSLFLYRVEPNPFIANLEWQVTSATSQVAPPFALNLHYLLTPYGTDLSQIQQILGEVLRAFHEQPVIRTGHPALSPDLATMTEELRIVPNRLPLADVLELWKSFNNNVPYRLSVTYEVSTVIIDSRITRNVSRVQERHVDLSTMR
jgi:hypothetical protein